MDRAKIEPYVFAGKSIFTIQSKRTGTRFTFKVRAKKDTPDVFHVSVLVTPDNVNGYEYIGSVNRTRGVYYHGKNAQIMYRAPSVQAFVWFYRKLREGGALDQMDFHPSGTCGRCGRVLTTPESIEAGLGPECAERTFKMEAEADEDDIHFLHGFPMGD